MPLYHYLAEIEVRGTDLLHRPDEHENINIDGKKAQQKVIRWNNIVRNLASRNAGRMILMDLEHELRAMDKARFTTDGVRFDSMEGQVRMNRVFQERLDELEVELFDKGVLRREETANEPAMSTFVPPNLETRLGSVPAVPQVQQSSSVSGQRMDVLDRLGETPVRRTNHPRRRLGPVNSTTDTTSGTSRSDTPSTSREF